LEVCACPVKIVFVTHPSAAPRPSVSCVQLMNSPSAQEASTHDNPTDFSAIRSTESITLLLRPELQLQRATGDAGSGSVCVYRFQKSVRKRSLRDFPEV